MINNCQKPLAFLPEIADNKGKSETWSKERMKHAAAERRDERPR
jgi:hypothetical protein